MPGHPSVSAREVAVYGEDKIRVNAWLSANIGLWVVAYSAAGHTFGGVQPQLLATYLVGEHTALKASFSTMQQYLHLLSKMGPGCPPTSGCRLPRASRHNGRNK